MELLNEEPGYLDHEGEQLYFVLHEAVGRPRGQVLLVGPFSGARQDSYLAWVSWARQLAGHGFQTLRFDYRGVGESTGRFEDMCCTHWYDDLKRFIRLLRESVQRPLPLTVHGLGLGGIFASWALAEGLADAMVAWSSPKSVRDMMLELLRFRLAQDIINDPSAPRRTREEYVADIESGQSIEVGEYVWTRQFWEDAERWALRGDHENGGAARPRKLLRLTQRDGQLYAGTGMIVRADPTTKMRPLVAVEDSPAVQTTLPWLLDQCSQEEQR